MRIAAPALALALIACRSAPVAPPVADLAITNATVIDGTSDTPRRDVTLLVNRGRIVRMERSDRVSVPPAARVINARNRYVIPGLCDVHSHLWHGEPMLALFLAHGVTCVRDMGTPLMEIARLRAGVNEGRFPGPRILAAAGPWLNATVWQGRTELVRVVASDGDATKAVTTAKTERADFVKVLNDLPRAAFVAAATEARRQKLPLAGHLPNSLDAAEAIDLGLNSIEHLFLYRLAFSSREAELRPKLLAALAAGDAATLGRLNGEALASYSAEKERAVLKTLADRSVYVTPTLVAHQWVSVLGDSAFASDTRLAFVPDSVRDAWALQRPATPARSEEARNAALATYKQQEALVLSMQRAGIRIMTGTDAGDAYRYAGSSLHDEMRLLVRAGLTPLQAIRASTITPATYLGAADSLGTVAPGKLADLVILDADPLADIENTRKITHVIRGGRVLERSELDSMMQQARQVASSATMQPTLVEASRTLSNDMERFGAREALGKALASDAMLLMPRQPALIGDRAGREFLERHPTAPTAMRWETMRAESSADGRDGYTVERGFVTADLGEGVREVPALFLIYWRMRPESGWKVLSFVYNIRAPDSSRLVALDGANGEASAPPSTGSADQSQLLEIDRAFAKTAEERGVGVAFGEFAAPNALVLDDGHPRVGPAAARQAFTFPQGETLTWSPTRAAIATSGDLGLTIGDGTYRTASGQSFHSKYLSIWKRQPDGSWRYAADLGNSRPAP